MVVNRFFDRNPAFEQDEVLFELVNPVCPWIKSRQSLFPPPFTVEAVIVVKGNCGNQVATKDAPDSLGERGLSRPAVTGDPKGKDIG